MKNSFKNWLLCSYGAKFFQELAKEENVEFCPIQSHKYPFTDLEQHVCKNNIRFSGDLTPTFHLKRITKVSGDWEKSCPTHMSPAKQKQVARILWEERSFDVQCEKVNSEHV